MDVLGGVLQSLVDPSPGFPFAFLTGSLAYKTLSLFFISMKAQTNFLQYLYHHIFVKININSIQKY